MGEIAIIDIGSRSVVMEIFSVHGDSFKEVHFSSESTFLGKDMTRDGNISDTALSRTYEVLKEYKSIIDVYTAKNMKSPDGEPVRIYAVCTAALRMAKNSDEALIRIRDILGKTAEVEVISGEKEAYYDYLGVVNTTAMRDFVIVDTGGSSTEIVLVRERKMVKSVSIPYGGASITERHFPHGVAANHNLSEAEHSLTPVIEQIDWLKDAKGLPIIGCGSAIRNLSKAEMKKRIATCSSLHGYMINYSNFNFMYKQIAHMQVAERQEKLDISSVTAEIIVGGLVPLKVIFGMLNTRRLYFSEYGLRHGVFYEKFAQLTHRLSPVEPDVLAASCMRLVEQYACDAAHSKLVERLALSIFDQTMTLHRMGDRYRKVLSVAAKLHDCGEYIQYHNHHKHSFYLIKESDIYGLDQWDKFFAGIVAGSHRKEKLKINRWQHRRALDNNTYSRLKELGAFLAIAEQVAERDFAVSNVKCQISPQSLQVIIERKDKKRGTPIGNYTTVFKRMFGRKVFIV